MKESNDNQPWVWRKSNKNLNSGLDIQDSGKTRPDRTLILVEEAEERCHLDVDVAEEDGPVAAEGFRFWVEGVPAGTADGDDGGVGAGVLRVKGFRTYDFSGGGFETVVFLRLKGFETEGGGEGVGAFGGEWVGDGSGEMEEEKEGGCRRWSSGGLLQKPTSGFVFHHFWSFAIER